MTKQKEIHDKARKIGDSKHGDPDVPDVVQNPEMDPGAPRVGADPGG